MKNRFLMVSAFFVLSVRPAFPQTDTSAGTASSAIKTTVVRMTSQEAPPETVFTPSAGSTMATDAEAPAANPVQTTASSESAVAAPVQYEPQDSAAATAASASEGSTPVSSPDQPADATTQTAEQPVSVDSATAAAAAAQTSSGSIIITSVPDSTTIVINDINVGQTPYNATGFYPGIYEVVLYKDGYAQFRKTIDLKPNSTEFVTGTLEPEPGRLFVTTMPDSATVFIDDSAIGVSPVLSQPLASRIYRLHVERTGYASYAEQLRIEPRITDTIQVTLTALEKPVLLANGLPFTSLKRSQTPRRIAFGSAGIVALTTGIICNFAVGRNLDLEDQAYERYMVTGKSGQEYDVLYDDYLTTTKKTDHCATARNVCYVLGAICGAGFALSIPF